MDVCRVCLSNNPGKDISQLKTTKKEGNKTPFEIVQFCLGIEVNQCCSITKRLCSKCFQKISTFYKFKALALRNNANLRSICSNVSHKHELSQVEPEVLVGTINKDLEVLCDVKQESDAPEFESDDEFLSDLKNFNVKLEPNEVESEDLMETANENHDFLCNEILESDTPHIHSDDEYLSTVTNLKSVESRRDIESENVTGESHDFTELLKPEDDNNVTEVMQEDLKSVKTDRNKKDLVTSRKRKKFSIKIQKCNGKNRRGMCEECGKTVTNVKEHALVHLPKQLKMQYPCKDLDCGKSFNSTNARNKHYNRKHLGIKQHCDICNKDVVFLATHVMQVHEPNRMPHGCVMCGRRFVSKSALDAHHTIHTKHEAHACEHCGKTFRHAVTMKNHIRAVHQKEKSHMCQYCSKSFFKKIHLQYHLRSHTKEKPHQCKECGRWFAHSKTLKNHVQTHSTTKDFHCTQCSMSFVRADYLRAHMISHTKIKKYPCKYCGVSFGRSDHRKRHEFTAHEKNMLVGRNGGNVGGKNKMAADHNVGVGPNGGNVGGKNKMVAD